MYNEYDDEKNLTGSGTNPDSGNNSSSYDHPAAGEDTAQINQETVNKSINDMSQSSEDTFPQNGIYRMKFENGQDKDSDSGYNTAYHSYSNYNSSRSAQENYYNDGGYSAGNGSGAGNGSNSAGGAGYDGGYSYYQQSSQQDGRYTQNRRQRRRSKNKKGGTGRQLAKVVCFGLVFGLVAGGTMWGVNTLGNMATGSSVSSTQTATDSDFSIDVVKISSTNVETIEATDVSEIVSEAEASIVAVNTLIQTTAQDIFGRTYSQEGSGAGSGIIFSEEDDLLYIVTNYHVIESATEVSINFVDDSTATAQILGYDSDADIAVLTVDMSQLSEDTLDTIKIAVLGDSDTLQVGEGAIAIGNALGYGQSVTTGTISAVNREIQMTDGTMTMIQTDAAINEGNSGGALLNTKGEVIGINTAKLYGETVEGMGYAIPINSALETINDILSGNVKTDEDTASLGIYGGTISDAYTQTYGWPAGVYVSSVIDNSAAQRAGIQAGYIITAFNGETVTTIEELQEAIQACSPGDEVTITVQVPDEQGQYTEELTLTTLLGSVAETNANSSTETTQQ